MKLPTEDCWLENFQWNGMNDVSSLSTHNKRTKTHETFSNKIRCLILLHIVEQKTWNKLRCQRIGEHSRVKNQRDPHQEHTMCFCKRKSDWIGRERKRRATMRLRLAIIILILLNELYEIVAVEVDCSTLRIGQYMCPDPNINHIDPKTQQPIGCTKHNVAKVWCIAADGLVCSETKNSSFRGEIPCRWT